jgi:Tfp pilus assembly protein PilF
MSTPDVASLVTQGIAAFNSGDHDRAYSLLTEALQADPRNEAGWLWMSGVVREPAERRYCLERAPCHSCSTARAT